jgi:chromosome segregation ATPase
MRLETALCVAVQERDAAEERERETRERELEAQEREMEARERANEARERETEALVDRERLEAELTGVERELSQVHAQLSQVNDQLSRVRAENAALQEVNARAGDEARGLRDTLGGVEEEKSLLELEATGLRSDVEELRSLRALEAERMCTLLGEVDRLNGELQQRTDWRAAMEESREEARRQQEALADAADAHEQLRKEMAACKLEKTLLLDAADALRRHHEDEVKEAEALVSVHLRELQALQEDIVELQKQADELVVVRQERDALQKRVFDLDHQLREGRAALEVAINDKTARQGAGIALAAAQREVEILKLDNQRLLCEASAAREQAITAENDKLKVRDTLRWLDEERLENKQLAEQGAAQVHELKKQLVILEAAIKTFTASTHDTSPMKTLGSPGSHPQEFVHLKSLLVAAAEARENERKVSAAQAAASTQEKEALVAQGKRLEEKVRVLQEALEGLQAALHERDLRTSRMASRMEVALSRARARGVSAVGLSCGVVVEEGPSSRVGASERGTEGEREGGQGREGRGGRG